MTNVSQSHVQKQIGKLGAALQEAGKLLNQQQQTIDGLIVDVTALIELCGGREKVEGAKRELLAQAARKRVATLVSQGAIVPAPRVSGRSLVLGRPVGEDGTEGPEALIPYASLGAEQQTAIAGAEPGSVVEHEGEKLRIVEVYDPAPVIVEKPAADEVTPGPVVTVDQQNATITIAQG